MPAANIPEEIRELLDMLDQRKPAQQFLLNTFFTERVVSTTNKVDVDFIDGERKLAPIVHRHNTSAIDQRTEGVVYTFEPPYIKVARPLRATDLQQRFPNEDPWNPMSMEEKERILFERDTFELQDQVFRRMEWMAAQQMTTGAVTLTGDGVNATLTLPLPADHIVAAASLTGGGWDQAGADPIADLQIQGKKIPKDSGLPANIAIFGDLAWRTFVNDTKVQALADNRQIDIGGTLMFPEQDMGVLQHGRTSGLLLTEYNEWYLDSGGVEQPMIPADKVILASTRMRAVQKFAAIENLNVLEPTAFWPRMWEEQNPNVRYHGIESAPLPWILQVHALVILDVIP